jgi:Cu2+-exporting ATPase
MSTSPISLSVPNPNAAPSAQADSGRLEPSAATLTDAQATGVDDPAVMQQCQVGARLADGTVPIGLGLSGMYCAACALTIEAALARVPGVTDVQVQGATQRARITLQSDRVKLSELIRAVQSVGYRAWPDAGARAISERLTVQRKLLWRLLVAALCMMQVMMVTTAQYVSGPLEIPPDIWRLMNWSSWVISLPVMLFSCGPFFAGAWVALKNGRISMDTPVALGIAAMFFVSTGVTFGYTRWLGHEAYFDSLTMFVTFLLGGRWLEGRAREKVTQSLEALCGRLPEAVDRASSPVDVGTDLTVAAVQSVPLSALRAGDHVRVAVGQAFPADGQIVQGQTEVDESLLTGESRPVPRHPGQVVVAGSMNLGAPVWCRIERLGPDTRYQQIVSLVHQALTEKPGWLRSADRFAGPFLWAVLALAALGGVAWLWIDPARSVWVAVSVLVVTCPCALSLAAPSALLAAAGALAKGGVLVRRLDALETLAAVQTVLFDKTGTLTDSHLSVDWLWRDGQVSAWCGDEHQRLLAAPAAALAAQSRHPLSIALAELAGPEVSTWVHWREVTEQAGLGLQACDPSGRRWRLGAADWVLGPVGLIDLADRWPDGRVWLAPQEGDQIIPLVVGFSLDEIMRPEAPEALVQLRALGADVAVLSGDNHDRIVALVQQIPMNPPLRVAQASATPEQKLLVLQAQQRNHCVAVVGDGINDAPVLARAHVSFALDQGAPLAQSQADFIVLGGRLSGVPLAVATSRRALTIVRQNLIWAAAYNFVCIPLALMGFLPPWLAGLGMALSSLGVMLNALRLGRSPKA